MKFILFATFAFLAVVGAANEEIVIVRSEQNSDVDGSYQYLYETANGISAEEQGQLKNVGRDDEAYFVIGKSSYTSPDGTPISLTYTTDENGFQPEGAHIPVAPPIPEAILRSLAYDAAHPEEQK